MQLAVDVRHLQIEQRVEGHRVRGEREEGCVEWLRTAGGGSVLDVRHHGSRPRSPGPVRFPWIPPDTSIMLSVMPPTQGSVSTRGLIVSRASAFSCSRCSGPKQLIVHSAGHRTYSRLSRHSTRSSSCS